MKHLYTNRCHSQSPPSQATTAEVRDAQGSKKKGKKYGMVSIQRTAKDLRSLHCAGDEQGERADVC